MNWRLGRTQRPAEYEWTVEDWQDAEMPLWTALAFGTRNPPNVILYPKIPSRDPILIKNLRHSGSRRQMPRTSWL